MKQIHTLDDLIYTFECIDHSIKHFEIEGRLEDIIKIKSIKKWSVDNGVTLIYENGNMIGFINLFDYYNVVVLDDI